MTQAIIGAMLYDLVQRPRRVELDVFGDAAARNPCKAITDKDAAPNSLRPDASRGPVPEKLRHRLVLSIGRCARASRSVSVVLECAFSRSW